MSCTAPGAHCTGAVYAGSLNVVGAPVYGPRGKLPRSRRRVKTKTVEPIPRFALVGKLNVHLTSGRVEGPGTGPAHWLSTGLGIFEKQTEKYTLSEFLARFVQFFRETHLRNILLIDIDYHTVYQDRKNDPFDLDNAIKTTQQYLSTRPEANKLFITALGKTDHDPQKDLHLTLEAQYNRHHGTGKPGLELKITGLPSSLFPHKKETRTDYERRETQLATRLDTPKKRRDFRRGCAKTMQLVMKDYEAHLKGIFQIETVESQLTKVRR